MKNNTTFATLLLCLLLMACTKEEAELSLTDQLTAGNEKTWTLIDRHFAGQKGLPDCAKDDLLIFRTDGTFDSKINGTQCDPSEADVDKGTWTLDESNKTITFDAQFFVYTGTIVQSDEKSLTLLFSLQDLQGNTLEIEDTFSGN